MKAQEFFDWCERQGLHTNNAIATVFNVSDQTIRNYRLRTDPDKFRETERRKREREDAKARAEGKKPPKRRPNPHPEQLPKWIDLAVAGFEAYVRENPGMVPLFDDSYRTSQRWFEQWALRHGLDSDAKKGRALGVERAAVYNWYNRGFPGWLPLACYGHQKLAEAGELPEEGVAEAA